jgi:predicted PurR-regulated permease PerM
VNTLLTITAKFFGGTLAFLALFLLTYYWSLESERTLRGLLMWIPAQTRENVRTLIAEIEEKVGGFVRGQALLCLAIGLAALIAYSLLGLPYTLVLALLAGIFEAVPVVGPLLGALPAGLIALAIKPELVIGVVISTIIIQALENYILVPRIMRKTVGVNSILSLLALITLSSLLGLVGALVAIPFAAILQLLLDRLVINRQIDSAESLPGRDYASLLHYEYEEYRQDIRKVLREKQTDTDEETDELEDELERMVNQMDELVGRLNPAEEV